MFVAPSEASLLPAASASAPPALGSTAPKKPPFLPFCLFAPWKKYIKHTVGGLNLFRTALNPSESMQNQCLLVFTGGSSFQGFLGGAKFCPSTGCPVVVGSHKPTGEV